MNLSQFMNQFRAFIRAKQLAYRTEKTYCIWVADFIHYHKMARPQSIDGSEGGG
ncbi:MAG: hypothetical protein GYB33_11225 [Gammaproteobacteria bacterium]|nr:hypothetical protein [Gammaproteobacteria bacterium]